MEPEIGFDLSDIMEYFKLKDGKVVYSEIVTFFKKSLSDPETQFEARIKFKDYVNVLATVTIENGKKFLVLRPKYMKKLFNDKNNNSSTSSISSPVLPKIDENFTLNVAKPVLIDQTSQLINCHTNNDQYNNAIITNHYPISSTTPIYNNNHQTSYQPVVTTDNSNAFYIDSLNNNHITNTTNITNAMTNTGKNVSTIYVNNGGGMHCNNSNIINNINNNDNQNLLPPIAESDVPPRPPPRKKGSFSKKSKTQLTPTNSIDSSNQENIDTTDGSNTMEQPKTNHEVKKEIQELAKTPGRVKEHAQILNKLAQVQDFKLPMPISQQNQNNVANKIRSINHSDTDSGSFQILDVLKKRWILAASNCDFNELLSLLKEDSHLSSYCDYIMGYNALHWAAKFNKPEIINLIAGNYNVSVNIKSFSGCTPLHIAAQFKNEFIMKLLTQTYGADIEARDNYGKKAQHYLIQKEKLPNQSSCPPEPTITNDRKHVEKSDSANTAPIPSATESLKNNLRNKISHQSMLVRNTLRKSKAFQRRKSITSKG